MNMTLANLSNFSKTFPKNNKKEVTFPGLSKMDWKGFVQYLQGLEICFYRPFQLSREVYKGKKYLISYLYRIISIMIVRKVCNAMGFASSPRIILPYILHHRKLWITDIRKLCDITDR